MDSLKPAAGYFRVPIATAQAIATANPDPDLLAAWLVLRRFAYGRQRELTAAGAKKIAASLGMTRPRAGGLLRNLLAIRFGKRGESAVMMTAADWNETTGQSVPAMRGNAPVYVMPTLGGDSAYLSDLLIPPGDTRSYLAGLCDLDAELGLDALRVLLHAHHTTSCGDFIGADPDTFACTNWVSEGISAGGCELGLIGSTKGRHYWFVMEADSNEATWSAIEAATGGRTDAHAERFWAGLSAVTRRGLLCRIAIVSDARRRLLYPLWVYGESHRTRIEQLGIAGDLARKFHRQATGAGFEPASDLASDAMMNGETGVFVCATPTANAPIIRTVYVPTLVAPTPDNMAGMDAVADLTRKWG